MGIATAANGGSLVLGHSNTATSTTTLKDKHGTPLSLVGKKSKPPLKVNSSKQVKHLNASLVGGQSASQLAVHGYSGQTQFSVEIPLTDTPVVGAQTPVLPKGTYLINSAAMIQGAGGGFCFLNTSNDQEDAVQWGGGEPGSASTFSYTPVALSAMVTVHTPVAWGAYCVEGDAAGSTVYNAGITAIRVATDSVGTKPSVARKHATVTTRVP
ncbi:MAG TPA: hypothetical protein VHW92_00610 [Mycobacteriales bacterium]|nr:hypothetical protein [Mycobacteriales bacterium]